MKNLKKVLAVVMAVLVCTGVYAPVASAEAQSVIIHVQDGEGWGKVNVYNWGDAGETAGVWPGTEMTAEVDNWFTYTIETEVDLNLVFSMNGTPQSGNVDPIAPDAGEVWIVIGGEGEKNELSGGATAGVTLYTEAQEGFPVAAADAADDVAATTEATAEVAEDTTADVPKTGETAGTAAALLALAVVSAAGLVVLKKKVMTGEN